MKATVELKQLLDHSFVEQDNIIFVGLSTIDGFNVYTRTQLEDCPEDKISALTSTIFAMGSAIAEQIPENELNSVIIESVKANILYLKNRYRGENTVLVVAFTAKTSLGEARFLTNRLSSFITELSITLSITLHCTLPSKIVALN